MTELDLERTMKVRDALTLIPINGHRPEEPIGDSPHLTDLGNAKRLVARHGTDLRYCAARKTWLVWDGRRWTWDDSGEVPRRAKETILSLYPMAAELPDSDRKALVKHALSSESAKRLEAMISLAQSEPGIPTGLDALDRDPMLLTVANGTLNLRTGELRDHARSDLITRTVSADYDPSATCPTWLTFLERIMAGKADLIAFLQRAIGYSLTGDVSERCLFLLHGSGRNGKTTLLETVQGILAEHASRTTTDTLLATRDHAIPNDVAALKGARFVFASEAEENRRLAEAKVKDLTGGDTISARFMRGEWFSFRPEFKIWLGTNHKPDVRGTDRAIWDRLRLVPFTVRIPDDDVDRHLRGKLLAEAPGILAWAVAGCLAWQRDGLGEPAEVRDATEAYRQEMDLLGHFIEEACLVQLTAQVTAKEIYAAYVQWAGAAGERSITQQAFGRRLTERGFDSAQIGKGRTRTWVGIGLLATEEGVAG